MQQLLELEGTALYLVSREKRLFELAAHRGASERLVRGARRLPLDEQRLGRALASDRAYTLQSAEYGESDRVFLESEGVRSLAMVPIRARGETIGVLVGWRREAEQVPEQSVALLSAVSSQLGLALQNARLFAETQRKIAELSLLNSIGRAAAESLDLEAILRSAAPRLAQLLDVPNCFITVLSEDRLSLEGVGFVPAQSPEPTWMVLPFRDALLAQDVIERNDVGVVEDVRSGDPRISPLLTARFGHTAYLGVPLSLGGKALGVIMLGETRGPRVFSADEVQRAIGTANQISVAIANARLYDDLKQSYAELARTQKEFVKHERMAALGELSAVVAHEVRNPLGVIFNSLGSLEKLVEPSGDAAMLLSIIGEEAARLNRMVGDLLDFARPMEPTLHPEALDRVVEDALSAVALAVGESPVRVSTELGGLAGVRMDSRLVRQALVNLFLNAYQAMPRGGVLRVTTAMGSVAGRRMATVEVADTGPGMAIEVQERIFQPFFTTKASGAGLGLAVVKRIVDAHGGEIAVDTEPGAGTRFTLGLPT